MNESQSNRAAIGVLRAVDAEFTEREAPKYQGAFISSSAFKGAKPGYVFQQGPNGLGYYVDLLGELAAQMQKEATVGATHGATTQKDANQLLEEAEQLAADLENLKDIDERGIKRIVAGLERRVRKNQELRMKFGDAPDKFMQSELEVHDILQKLLALAGEPELYAQLQAHASVPLLLSLLLHENIDIVCTAVDLLQELTDADVVADLEEESTVLVESMLAASAVDLLVQRLLTLKEKASEEEEGAVFSILTCFQNMIEINADVAEVLIEKSDFVKWLLQRLNPRQHREFSSNKAAAAELLAIAVQVRDANCMRLMSQGGVNAVLVAVEPYRKLKADLKEAEEEEYVHTLCDVLSACLLHASVKEQFLEDQGVELMLLIIRSKRSFRQAAIKVLNYATTDYGKAVERVIDSKGLNLVFGIFMSKTKVKGVKPGSDAARQETEHIISLIANIFQHVISRTKRDRVAAKFVENEFEKCDRMMEFFFEYRRSLAAAISRLEETGEEDEDIMESAKGSAGLYVLQQICVIFGHLWSTGDALLKRRLLLLLHQKSVGLSAVREHLQGMHAAVEDGDDKDKASLLRNKIAKLIVALGGVVTSKAAAPDAAAEPGPAPPADAIVANGAAPHDIEAAAEQPRQKRVRIAEGAAGDHSAEGAVQSNGGLAASARDAEAADRAADAQRSEPSQRTGGDGDDSEAREPVRERGRADRGRSERGKEERGRDDRGRDDRGKDQKQRDRTKDGRGREDRDRELRDRERTRDGHERDRERERDRAKERPRDDRSRGESERERRRDRDREREHR